MFPSLHLHSIFFFILVSFYLFCFLHFCFFPFLFLCSFSFSFPTIITLDFSLKRKLPLHCIIPLPRSHHFSGNKHVLVIIQARLLLDIFIIALNQTFLAAIVLGSESFVFSMATHLISSVHSLFFKPGNSCQRSWKNIFEETRIIYLIKKYKDTKFFWDKWVTTLSVEIDQNERWW